MSPGLVVVFSKPHIIVPTAKIGVLAIQLKHSSIACGALFFGDDY
jgi:hypothetical protein